MLGYPLDNLVHILFGFFSVRYPLVFIPFVTYQVYGYYTKKDDFIRDLGEFAVGHLFGLHYMR